MMEERRISNRGLFFYFFFLYYCVPMADALVQPGMRLDVVFGQRRSQWSIAPQFPSSCFLSAKYVSEELRATRERNKQLGRGALDVVVFTARNVASIVKQIFVYSVSMMITWSFIQTKRTITFITSKLYSTVIEFLTRIVGYTLMSVGRGIKLALKGDRNIDEEVREGEVVFMAKKAMYRLDNKNEEDQKREQEQYKMIFEEIDSNGDERISLEELKVYMKSKFDNISDADIKVMMEEADHDNNKSLDLSEFTTAMKKSMTFETTYAWRLAQAAIQSNNIHDS